MKAYGNTKKRKCLIPGHGTHCEISQEIIHDIVKKQERQKAKREIAIEVSNEFETTCGRLLGGWMVN